MGDISKQYGLDLNGARNKAAMPHLGRHPEAYHKFVFQNMQRAATEAGGNLAKFLQLFDQYVKQPLLQNQTVYIKINDYKFYGRSLSLRYPINCFDYEN